jgi:zinc transporter ZupT
LAPYLLLTALSVHGLFEGTALGVQHKTEDSIFLTLAILSHKWAEAFTLVKIIILILRAFPLSNQALKRRLI